MGVMETIGVGSPLQACNLCRHPSLEPKPLHGISFYIDADAADDEDETVEALEKRITCLGGTVTKKLSKSVTYFITGGNEAPSRMRRSGRFQQQNQTRRNTSARKSDGKTPPRQALTCLQRAKVLGLKPHKLCKVRKWLKEIERRKHDHTSPQMFSNYNGNTVVIGGGNNPRGIPSLANFKTDGMRHNDEELIVPFIKIEDMGRKYQPFYFEFSILPHFTTDANPPRTPFYKVAQFNETFNQTFNGTLNASITFIGATEGETLPGSFQTFSQSSTKYSKDGWCDFCEAFYRFRGQHVRSKKHRANIPRDCYRKLDELIGKSPLEDFLGRLEDRRKEGEELVERVLLQDHLEVVVRKPLLTSVGRLDWRRTTEQREKLFSEMGIKLDAFGEAHGRLKEDEGVVNLGKNGRLYMEDENGLSEEEDEEEEEEDEDMWEDEDSSHENIVLKEDEEEEEEGMMTLGGEEEVMFSDDEGEEDDKLPPLPLDTADPWDEVLGEWELAAATPSPPPPPVQRKWGSPGTPRKWGSPSQGSSPTTSRKLDTGDVTDDW